MNNYNGVKRRETAGLKVHVGIHRETRKRFCRKGICDEDFLLRYSCQINPKTDFPNWIDNT